MATRNLKPKRSKQAPASRQRQKPDPLHALTDDQRLSIYYRLIGDASVRRRAQDFAEELLDAVSVEEVAEAVSAEIAAADVDEVHSHSGRTRYGYVDPYEYAREYLEKLVQPFTDDMRRRLEQGRLEEAKSICMGIVLGLYEHRDSGATTDEVLGLDCDFPWEAAAEALGVLGGKGKGKKGRRQRAELPESFWQRVPDWNGLRG